MSKRDMLIVTTSPIYAEDGYKSRIEAEISILKDDFNITLLLPEKKTKEIVFQTKTAKEYYKPYYGKKLRLFLAPLALKKMIKKYCNSHSNSLIYGEALLASYFAARSICGHNNKLIFDCHGTEPNEQRMQSNSLKDIVLSKLFKIYENYVKRKASCIVTVTNRQYSLLNIEKKHVKLPMLPSDVFFVYKTERERLRKKLNIPSSAIVFVYLGSNAVWQMCEEMVRLYKSFEDTFPNTFFLVLTGAVNYFKKIIIEENIKHYTIMTVPYTEVPRYLDAADYGFCIRANNIINNVASPTKILEYLARDVKPIITDCIGDLSEELKKEGLACIMNESLNNFDEINKNVNFDGMSYVKTIREKYIKDYVNILRKL